MTFMELPPAFGKTTLIGIYADAQCVIQKLAKVIISVPNDVLRKIMADKCIYLNPNALDISAEYARGVFICTHTDVMKLPDVALTNSILVVDEFHKFCEVKCRVFDGILQSTLLKME